MSEPEAGFSPRGSVVVYVCTADDICNPISWPGVISAGPPGTNFWWKDGRLYDPETDGLTRRELEEMRFEFRDEAEPGWGRFG